MDSLDPKVAYVWNLLERVVTAEQARVLRIGREMEDPRAQHVTFQRQMSYQPEGAFADVTNITGTGGLMDVSLWSNGQLPKGSPTKIELRWGTGLPYVHFREDLTGEFTPPTIGNAPFSYAQAADVLRELLPSFHRLTMEVSGEEAERIFSSAQSGKFDLRKDGSSSIVQAVLTLPKATLMIGYATHEVDRRAYTAALGAAHRTLTHLLNR